MSLIEDDVSYAPSKRTALSIALTGFLIGITILFLTACDSRPASVVTVDWVKDNMPRGARVIEVVPAEGQTSRFDPSMYIIFEFRKQCFMMYSGYRRGTMVNIDCPTGKR